MTNSLPPRLGFYHVSKMKRKHDIGQSVTETMDHGARLEKRRKVKRLIIDQEKVNGTMDWKI